MIRLFERKKEYIAKFPRSIAVIITIGMGLLFILFLCAGCGGGFPNCIRGVTKISKFPTAGTGFWPIVLNDENEDRYVIDAVVERVELYSAQDDAAFFYTWLIHNLDAENRGEPTKSIIEIQKYYIFKNDVFQQEGCLSTIEKTDKRVIQCGDIDSLISEIGRPSFKYNRWTMQNITDELTIYPSYLFEKFRFESDADTTKRDLLVLTFPDGEILGSRQSIRGVLPSKALVFTGALSERFWKLHGDN